MNDILNKTVILHATKVAVIVGTVLLLINQYDAIFGEGAFRVVPALLTYCVPFIVFILGKRSNAQ